MMPGMIMAWHGTIAKIPSGWHLCDGNAGTINLVNKFLVCAGDTYNPGDTIATNVAADAGIEFYALCFIQKIN